MSCGVSGSSLKEVVNFCRVIVVAWPCRASTTNSGGSDMGIGAIILMWWMVMVYLLLFV